MDDRIGDPFQPPLVHDVEFVNARIRRAHRVVAVAVFVVHAYADGRAGRRVPIVRVPEPEVVAELVASHTGARGFQPAAFSGERRLTTEIPRCTVIDHRVEVEVCGVKSRDFCSGARIDLHVRRTAIRITGNIPRFRARHDDQRRDRSRKCQCSVARFQQPVLHAFAQVVSFLFGHQTVQRFGKRDANEKVSAVAGARRRSRRISRVDRPAIRALTKQNLVFKSRDMPAAAQVVKLPARLHDHLLACHRNRSFRHRRDNPGDRARLDERPFRRWSLAELRFLHKAFVIPRLHGPAACAIVWVIRNLSRRHNTHSPCFHRQRVIHSDSKYGASLRGLLRLATSKDKCVVNSAIVRPHLAANRAGTQRPRQRQRSVNAEKCSFIYTLFQPHHDARRKLLPNNRRHRIFQRPLRVRSNHFAQCTAPRSSQSDSLIKHRGTLFQARRMVPPGPAIERIKRRHASPQLRDPPRLPRRQSRLANRRRKLVNRSELRNCGQSGLRVPNRLSVFGNPYPNKDHKPQPKGNCDAIY